MDESYKCAMCGGTTQYIDTMKYKTRICMNCIRRISVLYPFAYQTENGHTKAVCTFDEISTEQLKEKYEKAHAYREELLRKYDHKYALIEVTAAKTIKGGVYVLAFKKANFDVAPGDIIFK